MRFDWPPELEEFRAQVRRFGEERGEMVPWDQPLEREDWSSASSRANLAELDRRGWLRMSWPKDLGGQEMSPWYQFLLALELGYLGVPYGRGGTGSMIGPAIQRFGTEAQRAEYLAKIWSGEISCALGYSEPDAGSDLASLRTRAVRDGDVFVVNGSKIWTSDAHRTSHVWLACRTDPDARQHRGISIFIVPLTLPGITIRPIEMMFGHRTNEVFFDDVVIPADTMIGEENQGWYLMATALDHERVTMGINNYLDLVHAFEWSIAYLRTERPDVLGDPVARAKLAELRLDLAMLRGLVITCGSVVADGGAPTKEASMSKVWATDLGLRLTGTVLDLLGRSGAQLPDSADSPPVGGKLERQLWFSALQRFTGGANEIQKRIIAERGLGLPRERRGA
ncbi:MAG TPA: acyl-CoA dehydrogenase family protein [Streptosporangiaceae bacterium]